MTENIPAPRTAAHRLPRVLLVDDEPNVLAGYRRNLRTRYDLQTAESAREALDLVRTAGPFAVVVTDMRMPEMDGQQFLQEMQTVAPDTVRLMLTGNADVGTAIGAVNHGHVFRFLTKPCTPAALSRAIDAGVEQYRLVVSERVLLQRTLGGVVAMLTDILSLLAPTAFGRAGRMRRLAAGLARRLEVGPAWEVELAAQLSSIGCVTVSDAIVHRVLSRRPVSNAELEAFARHPLAGAAFVERIPRLEGVAWAIARQQATWTELRAEIAETPVAEEHVVGAQVLKVLGDFDLMVSTGTSPAAALEELVRRPGWYREDVLGALRAELIADRQLAEMETPFDQLQAGMVVAEDVLAADGRVLLQRGQEINAAVLARLEHGRPPALRAVRVLVRRGADPVPAEPAGPERAA